MKATANRADQLRFLLIILMLLPIVLLFLPPGGAMMIGAISFWILLLVCFWVLWMSVGVPTAKTADWHAAAPYWHHQPPAVAPAAIPAPISEVMDVRLAAERDGAPVFKGPLKTNPDSAFRRLREAFKGQWLPYLQEDETFGAAIVLVPDTSRPEAGERRRFPWVNVLLFVLTLITTTWAGANQAGADLVHSPRDFTLGLPYSLGLLAILGIHELGHYFTAKYHRMDVTPPFFIPVPFALGTFGAFIQMKSPPEDRKALFDVAVAGPIAGLVIAIPALMIGLHSSMVLQTVTPEQVAAFGPGTSVGSSILFALLAKLSLGPALQFGCIIKLSPLAFAGWLGLFITALNLLPIGQLDGGHMAQAMFGMRIGMTISRVAMWTLFLLALFVWPGLFLFAIFVFFLAGRGLPPLNDLTPLTRGRLLVGIIMFIVLALIVAPLPRALWSAAGIQCPYL